MTLPFNLKTYSDMLNNALDYGYRFIGFDGLYKAEGDATERLDKAGVSVPKSILLRHDVDGDLSAAESMARTEAELGISSTYFLMWRSPCYNLMSRSGQTFAENIINYGHQIGLHYDQGYDAARGVPKHITEVSIQREANWLEELLRTKIYAVSFHQPSSVLLQEGINCGERINTYDKYLLCNFEYISDSNRKFPLWPNKSENASCYSNAISNLWPKSLQILIHPMWWVYEETTTNRVWNSVLESNLRLAERQLLETERAFGKKRKFAIREDSTNA